MFINVFGGFVKNGRLQNTETAVLPTFWWFDENITFCTNLKKHSRGLKTIAPVKGFHGFCVKNVTNGFPSPGRGAGSSTPRPVVGYVRRGLRAAWSA